MKRHTLITGASGFLGKYITKVLLNESTSIGRSITNDILCDLVKDIPSIPEDINFVVHAAGLAHVSVNSYSDKVLFYNANVLATQNLIQGLSKSKCEIKQFVYISSVAVYGVDEGVMIDEKFPTIPSTTYGLTKLIAEWLLKDWARENGVELIILRLPLLAGESPPGNLGRLINSIGKGLYLSVGSAIEKRSIVLASDVGKLVSCEDLKAGTYNLTDGYHPSRGELEDEISKRYEKKIKFTIPLFLAFFLGKVGDYLPNNFPFKFSDYRKLTSSLTFDDRKACRQLGWKPRRVLDDPLW